SYLHIDIAARHHKKLGYEVLFPYGFDDNGIASNLYVEKKLKISARKMERAEFNKLCDVELAKLEDDFREFYKKLGYSADLDNTFRSIDDDTTKISQQSFLSLYKRGIAERKDGSTLWCPTCQTSCSQSELEQEEFDSTFNYMYFGVEGSSDKLIIATTRPELLCGCVAVFVNPNDPKNKKYIGKNAVIPFYNFTVPIMANMDADLNKGSGVVMCCTFGDEADVKWQREFNLPIKNCLTNDGKLTEIGGEFAGLKVAEARASIIEKLKSTGVIFKQDAIKHNVATHDRCHKPVEIVAKPQWYIKVLDKKEEILKKAKEVNWYPNFAETRISNWINGIKWDWCISRQMYFGIRIPAWYCTKCGGVVVPNDNELPVLDPSNYTPKSACKCGCKDLIAETDTFDTWATSALTPQIYMNKFFGKGLSNYNIPMGLRPNATDNITAWDYVTIVKSFLHFDSIPWNDVMISGFVVDSTGRKISKSLGNSTIEPPELVKQFGADCIRYWCASCGMGTDKIMAMDEFTIGKRLLNKIWNASSFAFSFLADFKPIEITPDVFNKLLGFDKWIVCAYNEQLKWYLKRMKEYELGHALAELEKFFWNFCDNYIEIAKYRLYKPEIYGEEAKKSAQTALYYVLLGMLKQFNVYFPHITEEIYDKCFKKYEKTNSLYEFVYTQEKGFKTELIANGNNALIIIEKVRKFKSENNMSVKDSVSQVEISNKFNLAKDLEDDIKACCHIEEIKNTEDDDFKVVVTK
ncbi:MAG: valine--tRNA ligase, partial [Firmicutes bacterium]|nr:valine--tRNA ligase [Bacillota bacterium]